MVLKEAIFGAPLPILMSPQGTKDVHKVVSGVVRGRKRRERGGGRLLKDGHFRPHLRPKKAAK